MLIEGGDDRQVYDFTTDHKDFRVYLKYRSMPNKTKTEGYSSWTFPFTDNEIAEIRQYLVSGKEFSVGLICGAKELKYSQYAVLKKDIVEELLTRNIFSPTISIKKNEQYFRISIGGGRENSLTVKAKDLY